MFLIGVGALFLGSRPATRRTDAAPAADSGVTITSSAPRPIALPRSDGELRRLGVRLNLPTEPAIGRTVYVDANGKRNADGSKESPLRDLQAALCDLRPGDRLIIWDGEFEGPFTIGDDCADGTEAAPIELYAAADSVLHGGPKSDEPVLTVARAHWNLRDLMVVPLESLGGGIVLEAPAHDVVLFSPHIRSGRGNGIEIHPGVTDVLIEEAHLHHLGIQEGGHRGHGRPAGGERTDAKTTTPGAGIRIDPGTRGIRVVKAEIRNIFGFPVQVVPPEQYAETSLAPAADLEVDEALFVRQVQEKWW
jgi:hypothetical protein